MHCCTVNARGIDETGGQAAVTRRNLTGGLGGFIGYAGKGGAEIENFNRNQQLFFLCGIWYVS
jgi:hypothetical protein